MVSGENETLASLLSDYCDETILEVEEGTDCNKTTLKRKNRKIDCISNNAFQSAKYHQEKNFFTAAPPVSADSDTESSSHIGILKQAYKLTADAKSDTLILPSPRQTAYRSNQSSTLSKGAISQGHVQDLTPTDLSHNDISENESDSQLHKSTLDLPSINQQDKLDDPRQESSSSIEVASGSEVIPSSVSPSEQALFPVYDFTKIGQFQQIADGSVITNQNSSYYPKGHEWKALREQNSESLLSVLKGTISMSDLKDSAWLAKFRSGIGKLKKRSTGNMLSASLEPSRRQRQKHQINWLATEAASKEDEYLERDVQGRAHRHQAQQKYGW